MDDLTTEQQSNSTARRVFLKQVLMVTGGVAGTVLLNACGAESSTATPTTAPTAPQPTTPPTSGVAPTAIATSAATSTTAGGSATSTAGRSATPAIVAAANAFLATLTDTQRTAVSLPYPTGQKTATTAAFGFRVGEQFGRSVWSNYPVSDVIRPGLKMGDLSDAQRQAAMALLAATLSQPGYQKVQNIMGADQVLSSGGTNYASGSGNYLIGIFGTPSDTSRWMLQFGGHHLGLNVTIQGAQQTMAPTLTGCQPSSYTSNGQTIRPLGAETDKAFALINSMDASQQAKAILSSSVSDLVLGPGHDGQVLQPEGIQAASLNGDQQTMLLGLVGEWVNILNDSAAKVKMVDIQARLAETYFAWSGPTTAGSAVYFRVTGPTLHIEYADQGSLGGPGGGGPGGGPGGTPGAGFGGTPGAGPGGTPGSTPGTPGTTGTPGGTGGQQNTYETGGANHIHTIYRDPTNEYGTGFSQ